VNMWDDFEERRPWCASCLRVTAVLVLLSIVIMIGGITEYLYTDFNTNPYDTFLTASVTQSINFTRDACHTPIKSALCARPKYIDSLPVQAVSFHIAHTAHNNALIDMCMRAAGTTITGVEALVRGNDVKGHVLRVINTRARQAELYQIPFQTATSSCLFIGKADQNTPPYRVELRSLGDAASRVLYNVSRSVPSIAHALVGGLYSSADTNLNDVLNKIGQVHSMPDNVPRAFGDCSAIISRFTADSRYVRKPNRNLVKMFEAVKGVLQADMLVRRAPIAYNKVRAMRVLSVNGLGMGPCHCRRAKQIDMDWYRAWEQCCYTQSGWDRTPHGIVHDGPTNTLMVPSAAASMGAHSSSTLAYGGLGTAIAEGVLRGISPASLMQGPYGEFIAPENMSYSPAVPINNKCMLVGPHIKSIRVAIDVAYRAAKLHSTYLHHSIPGRSLFQSGMSQFWTPTVQYACFLGLGSQEVDKLFAYWNHFKSDMICSGVVLHCNITTAYRALA
jgi:hypothetical protein